MTTGWYGAELVFRYGTGVMSLPQSEVVGHQHGENEHTPTEKTNKGHENHMH